MKSKSRCYIGYYYCPPCLDSSSFYSDKKLCMDEKIKLECVKCSWYGYNNEIIRGDELKNIKRTKLIDKIINGK